MNHGPPRQGMPEGWRNRFYQQYPITHLMRGCVSVRDRERERETGREKERKRERKRERQRETGREKEREKERQGEQDQLSLKYKHCESLVK